MMSILPILKNDSQTKTFSWLHDGATIHFGDKTERAFQIAKMQRAVDSTANELRIPTSLDAKFSPA
jgi:DNA polymerase II large subunit